MTTVIPTGQGAQLIMGNAPPHTGEIGRFAQVYRAMADTAGPNYRPAAPSDGHGHITVPLEELDLEREALTWAAQLSAETDTNTFRIGCPNYGHNRVFALALEVARACCTPDTKLIQDLMKLLDGEVKLLPPTTRW